MRSSTMPALPLTRTSSLAFWWNGVTTCANRILCRTFLLGLLGLDGLGYGRLFGARTGPSRRPRRPAMSWVGDGTCEDGGPSALVVPV